MVFWVGCATPPPSQSYREMSYREILKSVIPMTKRLDTLARPLRKASIELCKGEAEDTVVITHTLTDYPQEFQAVAKSLWGLDEQNRIFYIRPDSKPDQGGLKFGDVVEDKVITDEIGCGYEVRVRIETQANAYADGERIFVTTGLMNTIKDLPLSLVIAHEMAHNILGHVKMGISPKTERSADRWAIFLLARAGLDYEKAILDPMSIGTNEDEQERAQHFKQVAAEIKRLREQNLFLKP
ncbi:MAG: M48 family metalloprotease [Robiginitomaculum sp.]|nr:M48 family metalloprotease [Robiginitomaculum sp.]